MARKKPIHPLVDGLHGDEATWVLARLLDAHPELVDEAEELARTRLDEVVSDELAEEVIAALYDIDLDQLTVRCSPMSGRYVDEVDAAYELMEEAIEPYLADIRRRAQLGLHDAAAAVVVAVLDALADVGPVPDESALAYAGPDAPGYLASALIQEAKSLGIDIPPEHEPRC